MNQSEANSGAESAASGQQIEGQIQALLRLKNQVEQKDDDLKAATALIESLQETLLAQEVALNQLASTASSQQEALDDVRAEAWTMAQQIASRDAELVNSMMYIQSLEQALSTKKSDSRQPNFETERHRDLLLTKPTVVPAWKMSINTEQARRAASVEADPEAEHGDFARAAVETAPDVAGTPKILPDSTVIFTIISKNYLASARALMQSIRQFHADVVLVVLLVDEIDDGFEPRDESFQVLLASALDIPRWAHFSMKYDIMELNTAVKPYAIRCFFERYGAEKVIYFDPDIVVYQQLDHLLDLLDHYLCVLTPHITHSLTDDRSPSELDFLRVGTYNLGFFAIARRGQWLALLHWWEAKLYENCTREVERGLFVDQHWMDLVPSLFDLVYILRDPGYNVAYWNIVGRDLEFEDGIYFVNGKPLVFFHFSGFSVTTPGIVSKHQNRFTFANLSEIYRQIYLEYRETLLAAGYDQTHKLPYAYGHFADGSPIPDVLRICLRNHDSAGKTWQNPFETDQPNHFREWATAPGVIAPYKYLSPFALTLYRVRADLQAAFPDLTGIDQLRYATWFAGQRTPEELFQPLYCEPIAEALAKDAETLGAEGIVPQQQARSRLGSTVKYYRAFPYAVKPYLPPEAFEKPSETFTGPTNLYGMVRQMLYRTGALHRVRQAVGLRMVMSARYFFSYPAMNMNLLPPPANGQGAMVISSDRTPVQKDLRPGVRIVGYLKAETGVGQIARNLLTSVRRVDFPATGYLLDVQGIYRQGDDTAEVTDEDPDYVIQVFNVNADQTLTTRQKLGELFYRGHYNIGYWFWELAQFPAQWNDAFETYDEIWVGTDFVREAVQANTNKLVTCMPVAIDVPLPENASRRQFGLPEDSFLVLVTFDALSIVERKNPWGAIEAFRRAFTERERGHSAHLVVKVNNLDLVPEGMRLREAVRDVNGILIENYLHRLEVNALINLCDTYLSMHRSEGFGLGMAEAMFLGKPTIATAYSGNVDFMKPDNSYLVPYQLVELGQPYPPYEAHNVWAEPDVDAAAAHLRAVFDAPDEARDKGNRAARYIREHYNHEVAGEQIARRLNDILRRHGYQPIRQEPETAEAD